MFLHHTMSDAEILRSCEGCTSQHLRLVADRYNEPQTWDSSIGCIRYFVEWIDDARMDELKINYSRIEVL